MPKYLKTKTTSNIKNGSSRILVHLHITGIIPFLIMGVIKTVFSIKLDIFHRVALHHHPMSVGKFITKNILSGHYRPEERKKIPQRKINMRRYFMSYAGEVIITARNVVGTRLYFYTCICDFVHRGEGGRCLPHTALWADTPRARHHPLPGQTPPGQTLPRANAPWADTPLCRHHPLPGQTPPWADTPLPRHAGIR